jgi:hypothetical protein
MRGLSLAQDSISSKSSQNKIIHPEMVESAVQVSDSLRSSKQSHRPPIIVTHSQEVQVDFLVVQEEVKMEVDQPPQVTLWDLSDQVTTLVE